MTAAGMRHRWKYRTSQARQGAAALPAPAPPAGELSEAEAVTALAQALSLPALVARLLVQRGINEAVVAKRFLEPKLTDLHDPALLPGLSAAAARLARAVREGQPIVIYGDYDVDGVCASSILWHILRLAGASVSTYVPHRLEEGYGLNVEAIRSLAAPAPGTPAPGSSTPGSAAPANTPTGVHPLIISVDCGITALEPARVARELGVELIITDHHEFAADHLPDADILVHPRLPQASPGAGGYPFGQLCGAGVAFKLAWQFAKVFTGSERVPEEYRTLLIDLLSFAALGTVADIVPLVDENRVLTVYGLGRIKHTRFAGLNALIDASRLRDEKIDAYHVGFVLGPRLNACGRMGHAREAVHLLTAAQPDEAAQISRFLCKQNEERRATERSIFTQAQRMVEEEGHATPDRRAIVLGREGWHAGVVGIVASRLVERFSRPVVMLTLEDGQAHGSARSVPGVSIHEALHHCSAHLTSFGGHAMAAGLRLEETHLEVFRDTLVQFINSRLPADHLSSLLEIDADCAAADLTVPLMEQVQRLAPFGAGNPAPVLCLRGWQLTQPVRKMGSTGAHLKLLLQRDGRTIEAVWFNAGPWADKLVQGTSYDLAFRPVVSTWQGRRRLELHVQDVRVC